MKNVHLWIAHLKTIGHTQLNMLLIIVICIRKNICYKIVKTSFWNLIEKKKIILQIIRQYFFLLFLKIEYYVCFEV